MQPSIILVAGSLGAGKTTWIQEQSSDAESVAYVHLGAASVSIDATYLAAESGFVTIAESQLSAYLQDSPQHDQVYIELGFQIDPLSLALPIERTHYQRVVVLSANASTDQNLNQVSWAGWADRFVAGADLQWQCDRPQIWTSPLTGQLLDHASLNTFWYELMHAAYGKVYRAKGIFDIEDGRALHFDFVAGLSHRDRPYTERIELNLPLWIEGRPTRFSGIEVIGEDLNQDAIAQTLTDCCLEDGAIAYYQAQIRASLGEHAA
jgi:G3E family GTPase